MACQIGVNPKWIQKAGTTHEHFDISLGKRRLAVKRGAIEITMKELVTKLKVRRRDADNKLLAYGP